MVASLAGVLAATVPAVAANAKGGAKPPKPPKGGHTAPTYPAWTAPLVLHGGGAEPSIRSAPNTQNFAAEISAPAAAGSNFWNVKEIVNPDGSHTFKPSAGVQPDLGTGGGDSEISYGNQLNSSGCPTIAYSGLHNIDLLDNFTTASSTDCGQTWSLANPYATQNTLTDRQWQTFDGAKTNLLAYHKVDTSQIVVSRSFDGGQTYLSSSPTGTGLEGGGIIDAATMPNVAQANKIGNLVTDYSHPIAGATYPVSGEQIHTLYAVFAGPHDPSDNAAAQVDMNTGTYDHNDTIYVAKSVDGGQTWTDHVAYTTPPTTNRELDMVFPVVTVDKVGNVYALWSDQYRIEYTVSTDGGQTWSPAYQINTDVPTVASGVAVPGGRSNLFPWFAAGGDGKLDVVWYHGEGGDTSAYRNPGTADTKWTVAFAQLFDAHKGATAKTAPTPTVTSYSQTVTPVIHTGSVCNNGTTCGITGPGDRTLLDFFQVAIDPQGRANIAYATDADSPGSAKVGYTRQNAGLSALDGSAVPNLNVLTPTLPQGTACPGPQVLDASGDAPARTAPPVGTPGSNVDSADITGVTFKTPDATHVSVTIQVANLSAIPPAGTASGIWRAFWNFSGKTWYVDASSNGPGLQTYDVGFLDSTGTESSTGTPDGTFTEGPNGTVTFTVDRSTIGNPANGAVFSQPYATTFAGFLVLGTGIYWTAPMDQAPDAGSGTAWTVGAC